MAEKFLTKTGIAKRRELLQFYLQIGCLITKIHDVIEFEQKAFLKPYIETCMERRAAFKDVPIMNELFKFMANNVFGRTILNLQNFGTTTTMVDTGILNIISMILDS